MSWYQKNDPSFQTQCSIKNNVVQTTVYPSLPQVEMTMRAPVLIQQFTHVVHPNRSHRLLYLFQKIANMTEKMDFAVEIYFRRKVKSPSSPSWVELLALLSRSCLSLLPANRQSRKLLASARLYFRSCCFVIVVYPDVWLEQNTLLLGACTVEA